MGQCCEWLDFRVFMTFEWDGEMLGAFHAEPASMDAS